MTEIGYISSSNGNEIENIEDTLHFLLQQSKEYISQSKAANTVRSYQSDWRHFKEWCEKYQLPYLPTNDETYALYLSSLTYDGKRTSTIQRRMSAISQAHRTD